MGRPKGSKNKPKTDINKLDIENLTSEQLEGMSNTDLDKLVKRIDKEEKLKKKVKQIVESYDEQMRKWNKIDEDVSLTKKLKARLKFEHKEWWNIRALLGNHWAHWFIVIGARERGKSYAIYAFAVAQRINKGVPFYWVRLNDPSVQEMLQNNGAKFGESLVNLAWNLHFKTVGNLVYIDDGTKHPEKNPDNLLCQCLALSTAHTLKGSSIYQADKWVGCNIIIDEFQFETYQKKTFSPYTQLKILLECICRSNYEGVRIFLIGNATEDCNEILASIWNFLPMEPGIFKLRYKNPAKCAVIDNIPNSAAYEARREKSFLTAMQRKEGDGNTTNRIKRDTSQVYKGRLFKPQYIIKFTNFTDDWFTVWDNGVIAKWNGEKKPGFAMVRYLDERRDPDFVNSVFERIDTRSYKFKNLITQVRFKEYLSKIKKS